MRRRVLLLALLVPAACASADRADRVEVDALERPPAPYGAQVIALPGEPDGVDRAEAPLTAATFGLGDGPAPVMNTSFEPASAVCNDWAADGAEAIRSVPPHSGTYACRVCATGALPYLALERSAGPLAAGRYVLTAWVRKRPHHDGPAEVVAHLDADTAAGTLRATAPLAAGDDYAKLRVAIELPKGATSILARISAAAKAGQCLLVDDVVLARAP